MLSTSWTTYKLKTFELPLDYCITLWYNKDTIKKGGIKMNKEKLVKGLVDEFIDTYCGEGLGKNTFIIKKLAEQMVAKYEIEEAILKPIEAIIEEDIADRVSKIE